MRRTARLQNSILMGSAVMFVAVAVDDLRAANAAENVAGLRVQLEGGVIVDSGKDDGTTAPIAAAGTYDPPLVGAAKKAQWGELRALLEQGAEVNEREGDGATALHWASYWDDLESADLLIRAGADVNAANDLGATPLWLTAENGSVAMARRLLDAGADPNATLLLGETVVMTAAGSGSADLVELLVSKGADVNARAARGQTALLWAASERHSAVVEVLLAHRADLRARSDVWPQLWQTTEGQHVPPDHRVWIQEGGYTPFLFAARVGDLASAKLLVASGADVNDEAASGKSATILAIESVRDFDGYLPQPAGAGAIGGGQVPLHAEPPSDGSELVEFLLEYDADPNAAAAGYTALHVAILRGNERAVSALLAHGADPNAILTTGTPQRRYAYDFFFDTAFVGATPFWLAARFRQPNVMRLLVEYGGDPQFEHYVDYLEAETGAAGWIRLTEGATTALMAAVGMPRGQGFAYRQPVNAVEAEALTLEAVKVAVELGVHVNAVNANGRTALDAVTALGYDSVVEFLIENGAD